MANEAAHVDFETFSAVDIKLGGCRYAEDPSTEVLCLAWAIGDDDPELWLPGDHPPRRLFEFVAEGGLVHAWNVEFEIPIWREQSVKKWLWPKIPLWQWRDNAAIALSLSLPANLEDAGAALGLDVVKDPRGKRLIHKLCKPRRPSKNNPATRWTPETAPQDFADLYEYCRQDVSAEREVYRALPRKDLSPTEFRTWLRTVSMNLRGWHVDVESSRFMIELLDEHEAAALAELREITGGALETSGQRDKALAWLRKQGVHLDDWQAATIADALGREREAVILDPTRSLEPGELPKKSTRLDPGPYRMPAKARRLLEIRQELSKSSVKKYQAIVDRACRDGTVKNLLVYHGAGTGRDAGRGIQIQNFPRASISSVEEEVEDALQAVRCGVKTVKMLYGSVPHFASKLTRSMLTAAPECELFCGDYSSIENRVTVWVAGCDYGIDIFNKGLDQYRMFGRDYYNVGYHDVNEQQRDHSKRAVLLCCFGGGWERLMVQAEQYGVPTTPDVAKKTIDLYRELYAEVVETWYKLNDAAQFAIRRGRRTVVKRKYTQVRFRVHRGFLFMQLPSGRELAYYDPKVQMLPTPWGEKRPTITHMGVDSKTYKWKRLKLIPGRIFENVVQATARDIMMEGAHSTIEHGYELVGRVHDELISQCLIGMGNLEEYLKLACPDIPWLQGIPIEADGWKGRRYRK